MEEKSEQIMIGSNTFYKLKDFAVPEDVLKGHYCFITYQYENSEKDVILERKKQLYELIRTEMLKTITFLIGDASTYKMVYLVADLDKLSDKEYQEKITKVLDRLKMLKIDSIPKGNVWRLKPNCVSQACMYKMNGERWYLYS